MFAQAMIEKGALDSMSTGVSTGIASFRNWFSQLGGDDGALWLIGITLVLVVVWRVRRA